ncbi:hypothetical protein RB195_019910 [Necator americanus]|uniref:Uncharacterized protein n=1 Tax=Necator americanus TaxID=51031 RepID=A0ABR1CJ43_NECAM
MRHHPRCGGSMRMTAPASPRLYRSLADSWCTSSDIAWRHRSMSTRFLAVAVSAMKRSMCSESSVEGSWPSSSSSSNLTRLRSGLGHSDPQISASCSHTPSPKGSRKDGVVSFHRFLTRNVSLDAPAIRKVGCDEDIINKN